MSRLKNWSRDMLDALADRAAEDGEHGVVAAYQIVIRLSANADERTEAYETLEAYADEVSS